MFLNSSTLASLRFFAVAARTLSFKQTAIELHVTHGAVSQHIKHLEHALGGKLFFRLPRQITLTEEGRKFAAVVAPSLESIERAAAALCATQPTVDIRLRAGPSFALRWLVPRLASFYAEYTNIRIFVTGAYGYFDPARREFDVAIELIKGKISTLHSEVLMDEYLVPVCSPEYLTKHKFLKRPKDLARCILLHDGDAWIGAEAGAEWRHWLQGARASNVDSNRGQFFSLANMSLEAALTHQGVAMGRGALIKELLETGQLVTPLRQWVKSIPRYCLVYPKELAERPGVKTVIRWLHEQANREGTSGRPGDI